MSVSSSAYVIPKQLPTTDSRHPFEAFLEIDSIDQFEIEIRSGHRSTHPRLRRGPGDDGGERTRLLEESAHICLAPAAEAFKRAAPARRLLFSRSLFVLPRG